MGQPPVLTRHQFASAAKELVRDQEDKRLKADDPISILYQGWVWQEHSTYSHLGYLERSVTVYDGLPVDIEDPATDDAVLETLDASEAPSCQSLPRFMMQQYVAWSVTYEVPVFYFTLHDSGGAPIPLDRMYNTSIFRKSRQLAKTPKDLTSALFPASSQSDVHEEESVPFPLLSQGDHPVLGTPCWYLHPCESPFAVWEILKESLGDQWAASDRDSLLWLRTWFMVLSGVIDLGFN